MLSRPFPRSLRRALLVGLYGLIAAAFCRPLFSQPEALGISDWDQHLFYYAAVIKSVVEYGQPPWWNPWYCGGNVLWQNPQVALLSPTYPLTAVMSLALAMKVNILLHYWLGLIGMHLLLVRAVGLTFLPAVLFFALAYVGAGAPALHLAVGHSVFLPVFYLPWLMFFVLRAIGGGMPRDVILGGAVFSLLVYNGGLHTVPMAIVATSMFAVVVAALTRAWRPLTLVVMVFVAGLAFAAPKLFPAALFVTGERFVDARDPTEHPDFMTLEMLRRAYTDPHQSLELMFEFQRHGWWEFGNYVGGVAVALFCGSLVWIVFYRGQSERAIGLALAGTSLLLLILSAGEFAAYAPAWLANDVPFLAHFRVPSRYTIPCVLMATLTTAWALRGFNDAKPLIRIGFAAVCLYASFDLIARNSGALQHVFVQAPLDRTFRPLGGPSTIVTARSANAFGPDSPMLRALMSDMSFFDCYEPLQLIRTAGREPPLAFSDGVASIVSTSVSPNQIRVQVVGGPEPSRLFLNQNYAPGWRSTVGPVTLDPVARKPSVAIPAGFAGRIEFSYWPPGLWVGVATFIAAVGLSSFAWRRSWTNAERNLLSRRV